MTRRAACAVVAAVAALGLTACDDINTVQRPTAPVVLTGADLPALVGTAPGRIVAFRHARVDGQPQWTQIPVQVDQRKVVPVRQPARQQHDPRRGRHGLRQRVGRPHRPAVRRPEHVRRRRRQRRTSTPTTSSCSWSPTPAGRPGATSAPSRPGVDRRQRRRGAGRRPQRRGRHAAGCTCSARTAGSTPPPGQDYVDYDFLLTSGDYRTTYRRADGPEPRDLAGHHRHLRGRVDRPLDRERLARPRRRRPPASTSSTATRTSSSSTTAAAATPRSPPPRGRSSPTSTGRCGRSAATSAPTAARSPSAPTSCTASAPTS